MKESSQIIVNRKEYFDLIMVVKYAKNMLEAVEDQDFNTSKMDGITKNLKESLEKLNLINKTVD